MNHEDFGPSASDRNWAALAHASAVVTVAAAVGSGGLAAVLLLLLPLAIYLANRGRSGYVAFHALQSTVFQSAAMCLYLLGLAMLGAATAMAWAVAGLLTVVLVGVLLYPLAIGITLLLAMWALAFPLLALAWALVGAWRTYHGRPFEYASLGDYVARTMEATATTG